MSGQRKTMECVTCGEEIVATIVQAKKHGWVLWVGGARCGSCTDTIGERVTAANQHASFMRGWRDGACVVAMRPEFLEHSDERIRVAYSCGYGQGRDSRSLASQRATELYGHRPEILRLTANK